MANLFTGTQITITSSIVDNSTFNSIVSQEYRLPVEETSTQAATRHINHFVSNYAGATFQAASSSKTVLYVSGDRHSHNFLLDAFENKNYVVSILYGSMNTRGEFKPSKNQ